MDSACHNADIEQFELYLPAQWLNTKSLISVFVDFLINTRRELKVMPCYITLYE